MKLTKYIFGILLVFSLFGCNGCRDCDDPANIDCSNYDPCYGEFEANAEFGVFKRRSGTDTTFWFDDPTDDTIYSELPVFRLVYFKSKHTMDSVKWKVGLDPTIYTDNIFAVNFPADAGLIHITQIAFHQSKEGCFSANDGIDTVKHSVYLKKIDSFQQRPLCCDFKGVLMDNPNDTFVVKLYDPTLPGGIALPDVGPYEIITGFTTFVGDIKHYANEPKLFGKLQSDRKTLIIDYSYLKNGSRVEKQFVGVKQ